MAWKMLEYTKSEIRRAGKILRNVNNTDEQIKEAIKIADNWRASHAYPMHVVFINLKRKAQDDKKTIVAERLKRMTSIRNKLNREKHMNLDRMQDLGGCRVITSSIDHVYNYASVFENSKIRHIKKSEKDYIKNPKSSGYRCYHQIYSYQSDNKENKYNGMLIEIQFRTRLQHLWATAVEMLGIIEKQSIKSGEGDENVQRFFVLISSLFALEEDTPIVPNTSDNKGVLIKELIQIEEEHYILKRLKSLRLVIQTDTFIKKKNSGYCLLHINYETKNMYVYNTKSKDQAIRLYDDAEKKHPLDDVVLVSVSSFKQLKKAYPNYFADINTFIKKIEEYVL